MITCPRFFSHNTRQASMDIGIRRCPFTAEIGAPLAAHRAEKREARPLGPGFAPNVASVNDRGG
jgi:hypothetical protein